MYFKVEAEGDTLYVAADSLDNAKKRFTEMIGEVPDSLVTWTEVDELPAGEEAL